MANNKASFLKSPEFIGSGIGAGVGLLKSLIDVPAYENQVASRAIEARFAPLQGKASPSFSDIQRPDTFQNTLDYGLTGLAQGRKFSEAQRSEAKDMRREGRENKLLNALLANFSGQSNNKPPEQQEPRENQPPLMGDSPNAVFGRNIYVPQLASFLSNVPGKGF